MGNLLFQGYGRIPNLTGFRQAQHSLRELRRHIERQPLLDVRDETGLVIEPANLPAKDNALVEFEGVSFAYPSRPGVKVLDGISFVAKVGELTALVGPSGAGKSSISALLLREYDPMTANLANPEDEDDKGCQNVSKAKLPEDEDLGQEEKSIRRPSTQSENSQVVGTGVVRFAGNDLRNCNLKSLRSQISVVHQDPQLLSGTIFQNVIASLDDPTDHQTGGDAETIGTKESMRDRCVEALRSAEAWDFVEALPDGIDTVVSGGRTTMLSGGQQQRIALARALFRRPVLLILDEATSALSSDIEMRIRHNLERIQQQSGLTIISIAHRLQFTQTAHNIIVLDKGRLVDQGTFEKLTQEPRDHSVFVDLLDACQPDGLPATEEADEIPSVTSNGAHPEQNPIPQKDRKGSFTSGQNASRLVPGAKRRVLKSIGNRKWTVLLALALAIVLAGLTQAGRVFVQGRAQGKMSGNSNDTTSTDTYALIFAVAAVPVGLVAWGLDGLAGISAKRLQRTLASDSANNILQQEISYFDTRGSSAGTLTASLSKHTGRVAAVYTVTLSKVEFMSSA
jgi:ABC-type multidrug transport system fused ATPase/permease subunit